MKLSLSRAYITVHKFDVICLSETSLDPSILHEDNNLQIPGYYVYRKDYPLNVKQGIFTTTFLFHLKLEISITCSNALILKQKLKKGYVISLGYTVHLINLKIILSHLSITLN